MKKLEVVYDGVDLETIRIADGISYTSATIRHWCKYMLSSSYPEDIRCKCSDLLFRYFINPISPLNAKTKYFIRINKTTNELYLYRDRNWDSIDKKWYDIDANNRSSRMFMNEDELINLKTVLTQLNINFIVKEVKEGVSNEYES